MQARHTLPFAVALALAALPALAAPLKAAQPPVWIAVEGLFAQPGADLSRGGGGGLRLGYRITDQISIAGGFATLLAHGRPVTLLAAGLEATLDSTPIAPFLELSILRADPVARTDFTLAQRTGFGADYLIGRGVAIGAVVRYVAPLDPAGTLAASSVRGLELGLRLVLTPGLF